MYIRTIVGAQHGDEGKGKVIDYLTDDADIIARFNGGPNAGNTVEMDDGTRIGLRMLPPGCTRHGAVCFLGRGVAIDPDVLMDDIRNVRPHNPSLRVYIDPRATLITPEHRERDSRIEEQRPIGSTRQGVGPAYADRASRTAETIADAISARGHLSLHDELSRRNVSVGTLQDVWDMELNLPESAVLVASGAHGVMLDVFHGHYPFTTSNGCLPANVGPGLGIDPRRVNSVVGVIKAYHTMVGNGPFITEIHPQDGAAAEQIIDKGHEYGTVTGRKRRIGWLDMPSLEYVNQVCGIDYLAITHMDVLDGLGSVPMLLEHPDGRILETRAQVRRAERYNQLLVYHLSPGWDGVYGITSWAALHPNAKVFVDTIERVSGIPVGIISTGPRRHQVIDRRGDATGIWDYNPVGGEG